MGAHVERQQSVVAILPILACCIVWGLPRSMPLTMIRVPRNQPGLSRLASHSLHIYDTAYFMTESKRHRLAVILVPDRSD